MKWIAVIASFGFGLAAPAVAMASGGPVPPVQGPSGLGVPGSPYQFIATDAGRDTLVQRVTTSPWHVQASRRIHGRYGIPGADYNGAMTGLSADGRTLVLERISPNGIVRTSRLLVFDTRHLTVRRTIVLRGWSNVDAISPDGHWMYLIHYPSLSDVIRYDVQAYDLWHGRLLAKPIVDPRERDERMEGFPLSRVMSPDGRWAYTLYGRPSGAPFVHALDTVGVRAVCVDLPSSLAKTDFGSGRLELGPGARTLKVSIGGVTEASINARTFAVSSGASRAARAPARRASHEEARTTGGGGLPWELVVIGILGVLALAAAVWRGAKPHSS